MPADAVRLVFRRPFQWREFLEPSWFIARVALAPTLLVVMPFMVLISITLNILLPGIRRSGFGGGDCGVWCGDAGLQPFRISIPHMEGRFAR